MAKKKYRLFITCIILVCVLVAGKFYMDNKHTVTETEFTRADAARSIALLYFTEQECNDEQNDYFKGIGDRAWYEKYVNILLDKKPELKIFKADDNKLRSELTYKELKKILKYFQISDDDIKNITAGSRNDDKVTEEKWYEAYNVLVTKNVSENPPEQCELTFVYTDEGIVTDRGSLEYDGHDISKYQDTRAQAYIRDNVLIAVGSIKETTVVYSNVWINKTDGEKLDTYFSGRKRTFEVSGLDYDVKDAVADITVQNHVVTSLAIKSDRINGKVLEVTDSEVEVESFGKLKLAAGFKVYKNINGIEEMDKNSILVGYDAQSFVVAGGEICAAVIEKEITADNIRVLITNDGFKSRYHDNVSFTCDTDFELEFGENVEKRAAGEVISITSDSPYISQGRIKVIPTEGGKVQILSVNRGYGNPLYRGTVEISSATEGLLIVNELSLEQYLYAVVPSEMPVSYGVEALKVQAVCARSYAYRHLLLNSCSQYGAHVDDSTAYQVYNNTKETPESIEAVDSTYGEVMMYDGEVISAYFFSTSCGCTTTSEIWGGEALPYIRSRALNETGEIADLTNEQVFDGFIRSDFASFDSEFPWYRWNVSIPLESLQKIINSQIGELYSASPECVLTLNEDGEYVSKPIDSVGHLQKIATGTRLSGGVINELIIYGDEATVKVVRELNIRKILKPYGNNVNKKDGSVNNQMSMMPSAYFVIDPIMEDGSLSGYTFVGGGYGHGAGMSQNAVKVMAQTMSCQEILKYFYSGIDITGIYNEKQDETD